MSPEQERIELEVPASMVRFGNLVLADVLARRLSNGAIVERLVETGVTRLTAERIVALERTEAEPGRARAHSQARHPNA